jgi:hypothetical protein
VNRTPLDSQPLGQLGPQRALIEQAGGLAMPIQQPPVERAPLAVLAAREVPDDDMRVQ